MNAQQSKIQKLKILISHYHLIKLKSDYGGPKDYYFDPQNNDVLEYDSHDKSDIIFIKPFCTISKHIKILNNIKNKNKYHLNY